jgi:nickel transport protein
MVDWLRLALFVSVLLCSLPLSAHKLKVFAAAEGDTIRGQAYFVGGAGASGAQVRVTDAAGNELARLTPDTEGRFEYRIERPMDYEVVADTLDGHQASWFLKTEEFLPGLSGLVNKPTSDASQGSGQSDSLPVQGETERVAKAQCEQAVARQTRSMREALLACEAQLRLRDILGGLGYIVGLAGLGLWWDSRRRRRRS